MTGVATLEERMDDVRAVMDAAGIERAVLFGWTDAGMLLALFAATYPERVEGLVVGEPTVKEAPEDDQPWGLAATIMEVTREATAPDTWGGGEMLSLIDPSAPPDGRIAAWWRRYERLASTPNASGNHAERRGATRRAAIPVIRAGADARSAPEWFEAPDAGSCAALCERIRRAQYRELPGDALAPYLGDQDSVLVEVEEFVTGTRPPARSDRFLATVVFSDIVGSTEHAERLGDAPWRDTLAGHNAGDRTACRSPRGSCRRHRR